MKCTTPSPSIKIVDNQPPNHRLGGFFERKIIMERIKPRTLSGFMELLPQKQAKMERMMQVLRDT